MTIEERQKFNAHISSEEYDDVLLDLHQNYERELEIRHENSKPI